MQYSQMQKKNVKRNDVFKKKKKVEICATVGKHNRGNCTTPTINKKKKSKKKKYVDQSGICIAEWIT